MWDGIESDDVLNFEGRDGIVISRNLPNMRPDYAGPITALCLLFTCSSSRYNHQDGMFLFFFPNCVSYVILFLSN